MAHFAEIDSNNIVIRVLVIPDELESRGAEYLSVDLKLGGRWIQTSYNGSIRKNYAGPGYSYNEEFDMFVPPRPYPSWTLNTSTGNWDPPTPCPSDDGKYWWNEETVSWDLFS